MAVKDEYDEIRLCCIDVDEEICLYGCGSANDDDGACRYDDVEDCESSVCLCVFVGVIIFCAICPCTCGFFLVFLLKFMGMKCAIFCNILIK